MGPVGLRPPFGILDYGRYSVVRQWPSRLARDPPRAGTGASWQETPQRDAVIDDIGGGGWIRTNVGVRQRIYSPSPLATRAPLRPAAGDYCQSRALVNERFRIGTGPRIWAE